MRESRVGTLKDLIEITSTMWLAFFTIVVGFGIPIIAFIYVVEWLFT